MVDVIGSYVRFDIPNDVVCLCPVLLDDLCSLLWHLLGYQENHSDN